MNTLRHVLRAQDFSRDWMEKFFPRVQELKSRLHHPREDKLLRKTFEHQLMVEFFYEASTRTMLSFFDAGRRLGLDVFSTPNAGEFSSAAKGESLQDTIRVLCTYRPAVIVLRHKEDNADEVAAETSDRFGGGIPIINAGSGRMQHPTQSLLDIFTIWEHRKGRVRDFTIALGADILNSRTCRSLSYCLAKFPNIHQVFVSPPELAPPAGLLEYLDEKKATYEVTTNMSAALKRADYIYWGRQQVEREKNVRKRNRLIREYTRYCIGTQEAATFQKESLLLHPMPIVNEISVEVKEECPQFWAIEEATNGVPVRMQVIMDVLG